MTKRIAGFLLFLAVLGSGLLSGTPISPVDRAPKTEAASDPSSSDPTYETLPPALAADLTASGSRVRWESPERGLTEASRSRLRSRFGPSSGPSGTQGASRILRASSSSEGLQNPSVLDQRLLLQTAQLSAG